MERMEIIVNNYKLKTMKKIKNIYWAGMVVLTLLLSQNLCAQNNKENLTSPSSMELLKAKSLWFNSNNGAGVILDKMVNFNELRFDYKLKSGDFKRKFEGERERLVGVSSEGGLNLSGGYVWGQFGFNNEKQIGTLYNTTMLDPTRGNPYYVVDKNLSDWVKQDYNLQMKASSKRLWDRIHLGIEAQYVTKTGAKQIDPRSKTDFYTLTVKPAMVFVFKNHAAGLNLDYKKINQESSTTNSNDQQNQDVFVMKGLGNFYSAVVGGLQSLKKFVYNGNRLGGAVQYSFTGKSVKFLLDGNYSFMVEDVISDQTKPKKEGTIKENNYGAKFQLVTTGKNISKAELSYSDNKISGIEYVQVLDNSFEVQRWITMYQSIRSTFSQKDVALRYDFFKGGDVEYKWRGGISAVYANSDDLYILPESYRKIEDLILGINGKANLKIGKASRLLAGLSLNFKNNLNKAYVYGGADANSHIITEYMNPEFQFLGRSYYKIGGELSFFTGIGKSNNSGMYVKAAVDYYKPTEGSDNRLLTNLGVGFNF